MKTLIPSEPAKLRMIRKYQGWTLDEMANRIGCSTGHMSNVENGISRPTSKFLEPIIPELNEVSKKYEDLMEALFEVYSDAKATELKEFFDKLIWSK